MLPHPLTVLAHKHYQDDSRFNGVYSRNSLPKKVKNGTYVISLDTHKPCWYLFSSRSEIVYFEIFGVEHVPEEIKEFIGNKNIIANIFRVQANNSIMYAYLSIGFIDFILAGIKLTDFTSLFSPYDFKKNEDIILIYFKDE